MKQLTLTLAQAIAGFTLVCEARQLSSNTLRDYSTTLRRFQAFIGNPKDNVTQGHSILASGDCNS